MDDSGTGDYAVIGILLMPLIPGKGIYSQNPGPAIKARCEPLGTAIEICLAWTLGNVCNTPSPTLLYPTPKDLL